MSCYKRCEGEGFSFKINARSISHASWAAVTVEWYSCSFHFKTKSTNGFLLTSVGVTLIFSSTGCQSRWYFPQQFLSWACASFLSENRFSQETRNFHSKNISVTWNCQKWGTSAFQCCLACVLPSQRYRHPTPVRFCSGESIVWMIWRFQHCKVTKCRKLSKSILKIFVKSFQQLTTKFCVIFTQAQHQSLFSSEMPPPSWTMKTFQNSRKSSVLASGSTCHKRFFPPTHSSTTSMPKFSLWRGQLSSRTLKLLLSIEMPKLVSARRMFWAFWLRGMNISSTQFTNEKHQTDQPRSRQLQRVCPETIPSERTLSTKP